MAERTDSFKRIDLLAETAHLDVKRVAERRVVVRAETLTDSQVLTADLDCVRVEVSRVGVGRDVDAVPEVRVEGDVTVFPVMEERLVVHRQLVLKEEVHVRRIVEVRRTEIPVSVRREHAVIERIDALTGQVLQEDHLSTEGTDK